MVHARPRPNPNCQASIHLLLIRQFREAFITMVTIIHRLKMETEIVFWRSTQLRSFPGSWFGLFHGSLPLKESIDQGKCLIEQHSLTGVRHHLFTKTHRLVTVTFGRKDQ